MNNSKKNKFEAETILKGPVLKNPLVTIITVAYNAEKYLERTILSVINQSYQNIHYLIIDGGSTDGSVEIIKKYERYLTYWVSEKDKGISDAFNKGINLAKGELIGIINSDDWYEIDSVRLVVDVYLKNKEYDVFHGDLKFYKDNNYLFTLKPDVRYEKLKREMILNHPTCFVKKKTYMENGIFSEDYRIAMDYELMLRFYLRGCKFLYIPTVLANMSFGGLSDTKSTRAAEEVFKIQIKYKLSCIVSGIYYIQKLIKEHIKRLLGKDSAILQIYRKMSARKMVE